MAIENNIGARLAYLKDRKLGTLPKEYYQIQFEVSLFAYLADDEGWVVVNHPAMRVDNKDEIAKICEQNKLKYEIYDEYKIKFEVDDLKKYTELFRKYGFEIGIAE